MQYQPNAIRFAAGKSHDGGRYVVVGYTFIVRWDQMTPLPKFVFEKGKHIPLNNDLKVDITAKVKQHLKGIQEKSDELARKVEETTEIYTYSIPKDL